MARDKATHWQPGHTLSYPHREFVTYCIALPMYDIQNYIDQIVNKINEMTVKTVKSLWIDDLDEFEKAYDVDTKNTKHAQAIERGTGGRGTGSSRGTGTGTGIGRGRGRGMR